MICLFPDRVWTSDRFLWTRMVYTHHVEAIEQKQTVHKEVRDEKLQDHPRITNFTDLIELDP